MSYETSGDKSLPINVGEPKDALPVVSGTNSSVPYTRTRKQTVRARIQFAALLWALFVEGWNDGSLGPMIPRIQEVYHVTYTAVATIFIVSCVGSLSGAILNTYIVDRAGFGRLMVIGLALQIIAHILQAAAPPFPLFVISYFIFGVGATIYVSQANAFVASLSQDTEKRMKLGWIHAMYGTGALASPLVATQFAQARRWSFHYLIGIGLAVSAIIVVGLAFKFRSQSECLRDIGEEPKPQAHGEKRSVRSIFAIKAVYALTGFLFFYVGVEITLGGWIVTYIINTRGGGPSSGYISSGFFGGLTLGRVILLPITNKLGERQAVLLYSLIALGLEFIVWFVPSLIGDAVAVSFVGLFLGPFYPIAMSYSSTLIPQHVLSAAIGVVCGLGQTGSAVLPFLTGALASKYGIHSMQPLVIAMMGSMILMWILTIAQSRVN